MSKKNEQSEQERIGREMVACVERLGALVRQARLLPGDGTRVAGYVARALTERSATLEDDNPHRLRWPITETPSPQDDPTGLRGALGLVEILATALRRPMRAAGGELHRAAETWPHHDTRGAALDAAAPPAPAPTPPSKAARKAPEPAARSLPMRSTLPKDFEGEFALTDPTVG